MTAEFAAEAAATLALDDFDSARLPKVLKVDFEEWQEVRKERAVSKAERVCCERGRDKGAHGSQARHLCLSNPSPSPDCRLLIDVEFYIGLRIRGSARGKHPSPHLAPPPTSGYGICEAQKEWTTL